METVMAKIAVDVVNQKLDDFKEYTSLQLKELKESVETTNTILANWEKQSPKNIDIANLKEDVKCVKDKQEKFAWYIGIAVGVGAVIMFVVDKTWAFLQELKK